MYSVYIQWRGEVQVMQPELLLYEWYGMAGRVFFLFLSVYTKHVRSALCFATTSSYQWRYQYILGKSLCGIYLCIYFFAHMLYHRGTQQWQDHSRGHALHQRTLWCYLWWTASLVHLHTSPVLIHKLLPYITDALLNQNNVTCLETNKFQDLINAAAFCFFHRCSCLII